ncbi:MAG TPA: tetratricopeptide repeat protein [Anaerolineales bacterium]
MTGRQDLFQQAMNQGHSAAWDQMWERASVYYRQALEEFPDHPQALSNLGLALYQMQQYDESLRVYQRAARAIPNDPLPIEKVAEVFERLGHLPQAAQTSLLAAELYLKNRDANKAIENWLRVARLTPENLAAHSRLALVYERMGEKQPAVQEYLAVASLYQSAGDLEKAARAVSEALKILPNSEEAIQGVELLQQGKPLPKPARPHGSTAPLRMAQVRQLEAPQAEQSEGSDPVAQARQRALTELANLLFETPQENTEEPASRRGLASIMRGTGGSSRPVDQNRILLHLSQLVDLQTQGQNVQAAEELERAIEAGLDRAAGAFDLGCLQAQNGENEAALKYLQSSVKHADFALGSRLLMGNLLYKTGRMKEASIQYLEALRLADAQVVDTDQADDLRQLYEPLMEAQRQENDPEAQARLCENVSQMLMRSDWRVQLASARNQLPAQQPGETPVPLAEILTQARSGQVVEMINTVHKLANRGELRSAMEEAFFALQHAPTYLPLHTLMGELLLKQDLTQDAITKFMVVARTYNTRGESGRAIDMYRRIIELAPMDLGARSSLIEQFVSRGQVDYALGEYIKLADVYYDLADLGMARKTFTDALRLAQQSRVDRSWRVRILHRMADIDLQSLDWRQALRIFEQIRTLQPDDEKARASLVELNFRLGQEPQALGELDNYLTYLINAGQREQAVVFVEGLSRENPERCSVRQRVAELYRLAGREADAIHELDAVGEAMLEAGDRAGALRAIETILTLNPPNKAEYLKLLAQLRGN